MQTVVFCIIFFLHHSFPLPFSFWLQVLFSRKTATIVELLHKSHLIMRLIREYYINDLPCRRASHSEVCCSLAYIITSLQTIPEHKGLIDESLAWIFFLAENLIRLCLFVKNVFRKHKCAVKKRNPREQLMNLKLRCIYYFPFVNMHRRFSKRRFLVSALPQYDKELVVFEQILLCFLSLFFG